MRCSAGLSRVTSHYSSEVKKAYSSQRIFFQKTKSSPDELDESFFVYRGDVDVHMFANLKPGFA